MLELVIEAPHHRPVIPCAELLVKKLLSQESERPTICDVDKLQQLHRGQVSPFTLRTLQHVVGHMARFVGHRRSPSLCLMWAEPTKTYAADSKTGSAATIFSSLITLAQRKRDRKSTSLNSSH